MEQELYQVEIDPSTELKAILNEIVKTLAGMSKEERLAWFKHTMYVQPLTFSKVIEGTTDTPGTVLSDTMDYKGVEENRPQCHRGRPQVSVTP